MESDNASVPELSRQLGVDPKAVRAWMRQQNWRHQVESGVRWQLSSAQINAITDRFAGPLDPVPSHDGSSEMRQARPLRSRSVGDLLASYSDVLVELRERGLVRTNNAPIGDLAEYCAAVVYDGLLAPNSEKSYDLISADDRRVQVKVRLLRPGTSASAVFSVIRSFDFDVCVFVLIDDGEKHVVAAREWSAHEVQTHGKHRTHTNGSGVRIGQIRSGSTIGVDLTSEFDTAWRAILSQRG